MGTRGGGEEVGKRGMAAGRKSPSPNLVGTWEEPSTLMKRGGDAQVRGGGQER